MPLDIEPPIDPDIPVIDSHHHLFDRASDWLAQITDRRRFLIAEYVEHLGTGHNVVASVAVEAHAMYRADGPDELRITGETEFLNGQGAMGATGLYDGVRAAAGIVGGLDLRQEDRLVRRVLEAHLEAAPRRFKGIRQTGVWDADPVLGDLFGVGPHLYLDEAFRRGFAQLAPLDLSFDAFVLAPQLTDVLDLARRFPETPIVLNHLGHPVGIGVHAGRMEEEYPAWRKDMTAIANCPNVTVKMGGLVSARGRRCAAPGSSARSPRIRRNSGRVGFIARGGSIRTSAINIHRSVSVSTSGSGVASSHHRASGV